MTVNTTTLDTQTLGEIAFESAQQTGLTGAQVAVWDGTNLIEAATGLANAPADIPVDTNTLFQIGSTTKVYAAALNLQLVEEGLADLDEPVLTYLPDFRLADPEATRTVTLRQLHSMTSGIDNGPYSDFGRGDDSVARYVASLADVPQIFPPGTQYGYSNASTVVAGRVTEVLRGKCWEEVLRDYLLIPAGLWYSASLPEDLPFYRLAVGHIRDGDNWKVTRPWSLSRALAPAGSTLCTSAGDLIRFARLFLNNGRAEDGAPVLSPAAVETMQRTVIEMPTRALADGWCVGTHWADWNGLRVYGHTGHNASGSSTLLWIPERDVALAITGNVSLATYPFGQAIFSQILPQFLGIELPQKPSREQSILVDPGRYVGQYRAHGVTYTVSESDGQLILTVRRVAGPRGEEQETSSPLVAIAPDRFLPEQEGFSGNIDFDLGFVGADEKGHATHFVNGVFASRRVADA